MDSGSTSPAPPVTADVPRNGTLLLISAACALVVVIAAFMPWATALGVLSVSGTSGDGIITLVLGLIGIALSLWGAGRVLAAPGNRLVMPLLSTIAGGLVALIAIFDLANISSQLNEAAGLVSPGIGLILTVVAGIAWFAVSLTAIFRR